MDCPTRDQRGRDPARLGAARAGSVPRRRPRAESAAPNRTGGCHHAGRAGRDGRPVM